MPGRAGGLAAAGRKGRCTRCHSCSLEVWARRRSWLCARTHARTLAQRRGHVSKPAVPPSPPSLLLARRWSGGAAPAPAWPGSREGDGFSHSLHSGALLLAPPPAPRLATINRPDAIHSASPRGCCSGVSRPHGAFWPVPLAPGAAPRVRARTGGCACARLCSRCRSLWQLCALADPHALRIAALAPRAPLPFILASSLARGLPLSLFLRRGLCCCACVATPAGAPARLLADNARRQRLGACLTSPLTQPIACTGRRCSSCWASRPSPRRWGRSPPSTATTARCQPTSSCRTSTSRCARSDTCGAAVTTQPTDCAPGTDAHAHGAIPFVPHGRTLSDRARASPSA